MSSFKTSLAHEFTKGLWKENPVLRMLLGLCPTLAVTNSAVNGLSMGLAVIFTLTCSSTLISLIRNIVPKQVRIPTFIIVIATFVTVADRTLAAFFPTISKALGPYVPLIVVNCIILGRQEAFASKNPVHRAIIDALGMSIGFTLTLTILGMFRELLGAGSIFNLPIMPESFDTWLVMILPPGAFLALGLMIGIANWINSKLGIKS
ncbi:MAG: electron transport complex subunit RsxE [Candidatus Neomarinimicrobiota bacterium]|nr:electron transport complex subunit E [Candidatus Neomarinimicrobiota bacterium]RKY50609.1 MAG: electron transport complex subunit RsxE [Candidatus Neomarinimicrobiota bacterium]